MSSHPATSAHVRSVAEGLDRLDLQASIQIQMMGRHLAVGAVGLDRLDLPASIQIQMMGRHLAVEAAVAEVVSAPSAPWRHRHRLRLPAVV